MWPLFGNWPMLRSKGLDPLPVLDNSKGALQFQSLCRVAVASLALAGFCRFCSSASLTVVVAESCWETVSESVASGI